MSVSKGCAVFRDPTAVFRFKTHQRFNGFTGPLNGNVEKSRQWLERVGCGVSVQLDLLQSVL